jgi:ADP-ribose pyrophosphatase YjhB (NUDIX family)
LSLLKRRARGFPLTVWLIVTVPDPEQIFRQTGWPGLRARLFHLYFLLRRPMTLGVRALIHDRAANSVFLIRHTYVPGWQLPGGGVELGETAAEALARELAEEGNIVLAGPPVLRSMHFNRQSSRRDHVGFYLVENFRQSAPKLPDREIAEAGFFPLERLPEETTPATLRRIAEVFEGAAVSPYW